MASKAADQGFFLTENERATAAVDSRWRIYRVWNIDSLPNFADLGDIVTALSEDWILNPTQYKVWKDQS